MKKLKNKKQFLLASLGVATIGLVGVATIAACAHKKETKTADEKMKDDSSKKTDASTPAQPAPAAQPSEGTTSATERP